MLRHLIKIGTLVPALAFAGRTTAAAPPRASSRAKAHLAVVALPESPDQRPPSSPRQPRPKIVPDPAPVPEVPSEPEAVASPEPHYLRTSRPGRWLPRPLMTTPERNFVVGTAALALNVLVLILITSVYFQTAPVTPAKAPGGVSTPLAPGGHDTPALASQLLLPGPPLAVRAEAGNGSVKLTWHAPARAGSGVVDYLVVHSPDEIADAVNPDAVLVDGSTTTMEIGGLRNGFVYKFAVRAYSESGAGPFSAFSNEVTPMAPPEPPPVAVPPTAHVVSGVRIYFQKYPLSCEETATSMALTHQGIYLSQDQILAEMGADTRPMYVDPQGRVRWGDPYVSFVGNVNGSEHNYTGYQANYPPLVRVAHNHGATIIAYGPMSAATIYAQVIAGHPVVAYATWDWAWHPRHDYLNFDGTRWIPWIGPNYDAHVYTVIGVSQWGVLVNDPIRGQYWVGKGTFEAAYSDFGEAIVFA